MNEDESKALEKRVTKQFDAKEHDPEEWERAIKQFDPTEHDPKVLALAALDFTYSESIRRLPELLKLQRTQKPEQIQKAVEVIERDFGYCFFMMAVAKLLKGEKIPNPDTISERRRMIAIACFDAYDKNDLLEKNRRKSKLNIRLEIASQFATQESEVRNALTQYKPERKGDLYMKEWLAQKKVHKKSGKVSE